MSTYIYRHVYTYIYIYIHIHEYKYKYKHKYINIYIYTRIYVYIPNYTTFDLCMYIYMLCIPRCILCMYVCMHVCMHVCMYVAYLMYMWGRDAWTSRQTSKHLHVYTPMYLDIAQTHIHVSVYCMAHVHSQSPPHEAAACAPVIVFMCCDEVASLLFPSLHVRWIVFHVLLHGPDDACQCSPVIGIPCFGGPHQLEVPPCCPC